MRVCANRSIMRFRNELRIKGLALSVSHTLASSPKGGAKDVEVRPLPLPLGEVSPSGDGEGEDAAQEPEGLRMCGERARPLSLASLASSPKGGARNVEVRLM